MTKINYSLPGFFQNRSLNKIIIDLIHEYPLRFRDNIVIDNVYGSFPCIWNGGRRIARKDISKTELKNTLKIFNDQGIGIRHTFTNMFITESDTKDYLGNMILEETLNSSSTLNSVTVYSKVMIDYLRKNYPELSLVLSTTLAIKELDDINTFSQKYIVIPDYSINNDFDKLSKLMYPQNIELLLGEFCIDNCPYRKEHHISCSKQQKFLDEDTRFICPYQADRGLTNFYDMVPLRKAYISPESIQKDYLKLGINKFKIAGRTDPKVITIEKCINWLVKPEYRDWARLELLLRCDLWHESIC